MADGEDKKSNRYKYEDIIRTNEAVMQAIADLGKTIGGTPPQSPAADSSALSEIRDAVAELSTKIDRLTPGATSEDVKRIALEMSADNPESQDVKTELSEIKDALCRVSSRIDEIGASAPSASTDRGLTESQETLLARAAEAPDAVREAFAVQNSRIDQLALRAVSPCPAPSDSAPYLTSREQFDLYNTIINRRDGEFADKQFVSLLEKLCEMREDFRRLVTGVEQNVGAMSSQDVLSSFKTYQVDIENMLRDAGVRFGTFGAPGQVTDANLQRLVGVVETDDPSLEGTVAKRLSSGYEYKGKAVYKEKVMVYKTRRQP